MGESGWSREGERETRKREGSGWSRVGFAYRRPDRHPVPVSDDTGTQRPVSSTRNRHPVLDDGIGLKWGPGTVLDGSGTG